MMPLLLSERPDPIDEIKRLFEVGEGEGAGHMVLVDDLPVRPLRELLVDLSAFFAFERRNSAPAGHAGLSVEGHGVSCSTFKMFQERQRMPELTMSQCCQPSPRNPLQ